MRKRLIQKFLITGALFLVPLAAAAAELKIGEQPFTAESENISEDLYIAGGSVSNGASVTGDLFAVGGAVLVSGAVSEDLFAGGGSVTILSPVGDDARVGGGNVLVNARISDDLAVGGGQVVISGEGIGGDLIIGAGTLQLNAPVEGDARIGGGEATINSRIEGNLYFQGDKLALGEGAVIAGDLNYTSAKEVVLGEGARVLGETNYTPLQRKSATAAAIALGLSALLLTKFLMVFASALVLGLFFKRYMLSIVGSVRERPLVELGRGFAAFFLMPIAAILLFMTVIGIPLGALALLTFIAFMIFGSIAAPILLGILVYRWLKKTAEYEITWASILAGSVIYLLLGLIPIVGWLAKFAVILMVIGAAVKIKWEIAKEWR